MAPPFWLWIPLTVWGAFAQTLRNAAQRSLVAKAGTLGATLVRFLYGFPFAAAYCWGLAAFTGTPIPDVTPAFIAWVLFGGICQIMATALLLRVMEERNFTLGVAYSKTEVIQVAVFGALFLGDPITPLSVLAIVLATVGVLLLSPVDRQRPLASFLTGWTSRTAVLGFISGAGFGLAATAYRGASLTLETGAGFVMAAAYTLVWSQFTQSLQLGGWLLWRNPHALVVVMREWRRSLLAGFMGAAASGGWFTAMAIEPVAHVRTLGLVELLFSMALSRRMFRERLSPLELTGIAVLTLGLVAITQGK